VARIARSECGDKRAAVTLILDFATLNLGYD
jgi:hypothetical protein